MEIFFGHPVSFYAVANNLHRRRISTGAESSVTVRVIRTDEEAVIAASTIRLLELAPT